jgi:hypothetical protein
MAPAISCILAEPDGCLRTQLVSPPAKSNTASDDKIDSQVIAVKISLEKFGIEDFSNRGTRPVLRT